MCNCNVIPLMKLQTYFPIPTSLHRWLASCPGNRPRKAKTENFFSVFALRVTSTLLWNFEAIFDHWCLHWFTIDSRRYRSRCCSRTRWVVPGQLFVLFVQIVLELLHAQSQFTQAHKKQFMDLRLSHFVSCIFIAPASSFCADWWNHGYADNTASCSDFLRYQRQRGEKCVESLQFSVKIGGFWMILSDQPHHEHPPAQIYRIKTMQRSFSWIKFRW